jgi:GAF domain-containing protein
MARRTKGDRYAAIREQVAALIEATPEPVARRATLAAVLHHKLPGVSWTGFYLLRGGRLVVDAYQGPVACLVLPPHAGVCWAAVDRRASVVVPDVHAFPGHVPCDERSRSELVVPLFDGTGTVTGVLDLDSHRPAWFDEEDRESLESLVTVL